MTDKIVMTQIRLLLEEHSDQGLYCFVILSASFKQSTAMKIQTVKF